MAISERNVTKDFPDILELLPSSSDSRQLSGVCRFTNARLVKFLASVKDKCFDNPLVRSRNQIKLLLVILRDNAPTVAPSWSQNSGTLSTKHVNDLQTLRIFMTI